MILLKSKNIPLRKCVVCGKKFPKPELLRIVLDEEGLPVLDLSGKKNGRGAYLCFDGDCEKNIRTVEKVVRSLRGIPDTERTRDILDYLIENEKEV